MRVVTIATMMRNSLMNWARIIKEVPQRFCTLDTVSYFLITGVPLAKRVGKQVAKGHLFTIADQWASSMTDYSTVESRGGQFAKGQANNAPVDYQDLISRCMGNSEFAERILTKFEKRFDDDLAHLERELEQGDSAEVARSAHRLKGACANVSANGLRDIFSRLEEIGGSGELHKAPEYMDDLRAEWSRFQAKAPLASAAGD